MPLIQLPAGVTSISHNGVAIPVSKDGTADVPKDAMALFCESHGATAVKEKPAASGPKP